MLAVRYPMMPVVAALSAGIIIGDLWSLSLRMVVAVCITLGCFSLVFRRWEWLFLSFILSVGYTGQVLSAAMVSPVDLRGVIGGKAGEVTVRGRLVEKPSQRLYERDSETYARTLARLEVEAVGREGENWQPASGRIAITTRGALPDHFYEGQIVQVFGVIRQPPEANAPGLFDYRAYLQRLGIYYQLTVDRTNDWQLLSNNPRPLSDRFISWAQRQLAYGLPEQDEPLRLLWAMTLGWKTGLSGEVSEPFMHSGTMHVFAISGLHIAMIISLLAGFLRGLGLPRIPCLLLMLPAIWLYTYVTGLQASAVRSAIMGSVVLITWLLPRPMSLINSLFVAAFFILLADPQQLFQAGFQLSFCVVLALAIFANPLEQLRKVLLDPDPFLPRNFRKPWQVTADKCVVWLLGASVTSFAAWLGSLPLVATYFNLITPCSLLANLAVVPISSFALTCNVASLLCGNWLLPLADLFNHAAWGSMVLMIRISQWTADLPMAYAYVPSPNLLMSCLYYAIFVAAATGWLFKGDKKFRLLGVTTPAFIVGGLFGFQELSSVEITALPLQGGQSIFIDAPGRKNDALIDTGAERDAGFIAERFLRSRGINRLQTLFLTHGDVRHVGGAQRIEKEFRPVTVGYSPAPSRSAPYKDALRAFEANKRPLLALEAGAQIANWVVLHPSRDKFASRADDNCLVLRGEFAGRRVLFLSDLGTVGQASLLAGGLDLAADIVITGIAAGAEPLQQSLLDAINPSLIIIVDSESPRTERAGQALRTRLAETKLPVHYTSDSGPLTVSLRRNDALIKTHGKATARIALK